MDEYIFLGLVLVGAIKYFHHISLVPVIIGAGGGLSIGIFSFAFLTYFNVIEDEFLASIILLIVSYYCGVSLAKAVEKDLENTKPLFFHKSGQKNTARSQPYTDETFTSREQATDDEFAFKQSGGGFNGNPWGDHSTGQQQSTRETPYGFDKRHPDDAKFWAHADDPSNPPHVRKAWFEKALEREEARRKGQNPDNVKGAKR